MFSVETKCLACHKFFWVIASSLQMIWKVVDEAVHCPACKNAGRKRG